MRWNEWIGTLSGRPTMWVRHIARFAGCVIDVHKMIGKDDPDCFHTHPAYAVRIILRGGYIEELEGGRHRVWRPGMIGIVAPACSHRVAGLCNGVVSYSLWLRFPKIAAFELRGVGWPMSRVIPPISAVDAIARSLEIGDHYERSAFLDAWQHGEWDEMRSFLTLDLQQVAPEYRAP